MRQSSIFRRWLTRRKNVSTTDEQTNLCPRPSSSRARPQFLENVGRHIVGNASCSCRGSWCHLAWNPSRTAGQSPEKPPVRSEGLTSTEQFVTQPPTSYDVRFDPFKRHSLLVRDNTAQGPSRRATAMPSLATARAELFFNPLPDRRLFLVQRPNAANPSVDPPTGENRFASRLAHLQC
jgi:hypothetical protein